MNQELRPESSDPLDVLSQIYREYSLLRRLADTTDIPCYFFVNQNREPVDFQTLESYVNAEMFDRQVDLIQVPKACTTTHTSPTCGV